MKIPRILATASAALLPLAASAATLIIPAAGTGPGANNSRWQTEITLVNASNEPVAVGLTWHDAAGVVTNTATLGPRVTMSLEDVAKNLFGRDSATGAVEVTLPDAAAKKVGVTSRTFNASPNGQFGQDIPAVRVEDAAGVGDVTVLPGPSSAAEFRFNFGIYAVTNGSVEWELRRADGTIAGTKTVNYAAGDQVQYNKGISALFGVGEQDGDVVHANVQSGSAIFYGSAINNASGDPTFVPGLRLREDTTIRFLGVDVNEDGKIEIADADHDGVADSPADMYTSLFGNYFRLYAAGPNGEKVTFKLLNDNPDILLLDPSGEILWNPGGNVKGTSGELKVLATDTAGDTSIFTIPVNFR
jgi:hypothetical protein